MENNDENTQFESFSEEQLLNGSNANNRKMFVSLKYFIITFIILVIPLMWMFLETSNIQNVESIILIGSLIYVYILTKVVCLKNTNKMQFISMGENFFDKTINFCLVLTIIQLIIFSFLDANYIYVYWVSTVFGLSYETIFLMSFLGQIALFVVSVILVKKGRVNKNLVVIILMLIFALQKFIDTLIYNIQYPKFFNMGLFDSYSYSLGYCLPSLILWSYLWVNYIVIRKNKSDDYLNKISYTVYVGSVYQLLYTFMFVTLGLISQTVAI